MSPQVRDWHIVGGDDEHGLLLIVITEAYKPDRARVLNHGSIAGTRGANTGTEENIFPHEKLFEVIVVVLRI
jgi:hypothetical protein